MRKIDSHEYKILDLHTTQEIDTFTRDWNSCFQPGQTVDMTMLIRLVHLSDTRCPSFLSEVKGCETPDRFVYWLVSNASYIPAGTDRPSVKLRCGLIFRKATGRWKSSESKPDDSEASADGESLLGEDDNQLEAQLRAICRFDRFLAATNDDMKLYKNFSDSRALPRQRNAANFADERDFSAN